MAHQPSYGPLTIEQRQEGIQEAGWVWNERIDPDTNYCALTLSGPEKVNIAWRRVSREYAWSRAYDLIVLGIRE